MVLLVVTGKHHQREGGSAKSTVTSTYSSALTPLPKRRSRGGPCAVSRGSWLRASVSIVHCCLAMEWMLLGPTYNAFQDVKGKTTRGNTKKPKHVHDLRGLDNVQGGPSYGTLSSWEGRSDEMIAYCVRVLGTSRYRLWPVSCCKFDRLCSNCLTEWALRWSQKASRNEREWAISS